MRDLLKYALMGGAAYFAWDWWRKREPAPAAAPPAEQPPAASGIVSELQALIDTLRKTSAGGVQPSGGGTTPSTTDGEAAYKAWCAANPTGSYQGRPCAGAPALPQVSPEQLAQLLAQSRGYSLDDLLKLAATDSTWAKTLTDAVPGYTLNSDQWNYYWSAAKGQPVTVDLFPAGNRDYQMTAVEYRSRRQAAGLGGFGYGSLGGILPAGTPYLVAGRPVRAGHYRRVA